MRAVRKEDFLAFLGRHWPERLSSLRRILLVKVEARCGLSGLMAGPQLMETPVLYLGGFTTWILSF